MRAGRLSESPDHAARRSVHVRGETGGANGMEEANMMATPCTATPAGPSMPRLLRLLLSAALLHPPLRLFFSYSGGSRGVADRRRRSKREEAQRTTRRGRPRPRATRPDPAPHRRQHAPDESSMTSCERL